MDDSRETSPKVVIGTRRLKEPMPKPDHLRIFTVSNQKGGVGKTTTTVNIAAALAMGGLHVLVVDLDPQGNASTALGIEHHNNEGIYEVLMGSANINSVVQKVAMDQPYDYIFIDCPPSLGLLTVNALAAAQELLIPIQCEYYALEGLTQLLETYGVVKKRLNADLKLSTIILTMFDGRTRLANDVAASVRSHFPQELIDIPIPRAVRVSEAPSYGQTVMTYDPGSPGAIAYLQVAREIAERGKPFDSNVVSINYKKGESA